MDKSTELTGFVLLEQYSFFNFLAKHPLIFFVFKKKLREKHYKHGFLLFLNKIIAYLAHKTKD